jgi:hypothetical protein
MSAMPDKAQSIKEKAITQAEVFFNATLVLHSR